jgi:hypothetical protein
MITEFNGVGQFQNTPAALKPGPPGKFQP